MADYQWMGSELPTFVTHLECSLTGEHYPADTLQTLSRAGRPLLVRYDLDGGAPSPQPRRALRPAAEFVALSRAVAGTPAGKCAVARRGDNPARPIAAAGQGRRDPGQGRRPVTHGIVQGARTGACRVDGQGAGGRDHGDADQRQCRGGDGGLLRARRDQDPMSSAPTTPRR